MEDIFQKIFDDETVIVSKHEYPADGDGCTELVAAVNAEHKKDMMPGEMDRIIEVLKSLNLHYIPFNEMIFVPGGTESYKKRHKLKSLCFRWNKFNEVWYWVNGLTNKKMRVVDIKKKK